MLPVYIVYCLWELVRPHRRSGCDGGGVERPATAQPAATAAGVAVTADAVPTTAATPRAYATHHLQPLLRLHAYAQSQFSRCPLRGIFLYALRRLLRCIRRTLGRTVGLLGGGEHGRAEGCLDGGAPALTPPAVAAAVTRALGARLAKTHRDGVEASCCRSRG